MPLYLLQASYSAAAVKGMINKPQDRLAIASRNMEAAGGTVHSLYFAFGKHDVIGIGELPENIDALAFSMASAATGAFSSFNLIPLLTSQDAVEAMKRAGPIAEGYSAPTG